MLRPPGLYRHSFTGENRMSLIEIFSVVCVQQLPEQYLA